MTAERSGYQLLVQALGSPHMPGRAPLGGGPEPRAIRRVSEAVRRIGNEPGGGLGITKRDVAQSSPGRSGSKLVPELCLTVWTRAGDQMLCAVQLTLRFLLKE
jgi:hypothetical protein